MAQRVHRSIPQEAADSLREAFADCTIAVQAAWPNYTLSNT